MHKSEININNEDVTHDYAAIVASYQADDQVALLIWLYRYLFWTERGNIVHEI